MNYLLLIIIVLVLITFYFIAKKTNQYIKDEIEREYQKEKRFIYRKTNDTVLSKKSMFEQSFSNN